MGDWRDDPKLKQAQRECILTNELARIRDTLQVIVDGEVKRGHCVGGREAYGARPGLRKVMLKDAKEIAAGAVCAINAALRKFETVHHSDEEQEINNAH